MGQVSELLRRLEGGYGHWCPGCEEMHILPDCWVFNGDVNRPSFSPSFRHSTKAIVRDADGNWTGEWKCNAHGLTFDEICHYFLTSGELYFVADSTHALACKTVPLPVLPLHLRDEV